MGWNCMQTGDQPGPNSEQDELLRETRMKLYIYNQKRHNEFCDGFYFYFSTSAQYSLQ